MYLNLRELFNEYKYILLVIFLMIIVSIIMVLDIKTPDDMTTRLSIGKSLIDKNELVKALDLYSKFVRDYPRNYFGHISLGDIYLKTGNIENAKIEYLRAMELSDNRRFDGYFKLSKIYIDNEDYDAAFKVIEPLNKNEKEEVLVNYGDLYFYWGKKYRYTSPEESIRKYKKGLEYYKNSGNEEKIKEGQNTIAETYSNMAENLVNAGNTDEAEELLNISLKQFENPLAYVELGRIYRQKDIDAAVKYYDMAYKIDPKSISTDEYTSVLVAKAASLDEQGMPEAASIYMDKADKLLKQERKHKEEMDKKAHKINKSFGKFDTSKIENNSHKEKIIHENK
ncbi:MAG: tetratricopeptide repeat protein [bacterium]